MKWHHLPEAGGWYDQDPDFCNYMTYIMQMQNQYDAKKQREEEAKQNRASRTGKSRSVPRGR